MSKKKRLELRRFKLLSRDKAIIKTKKIIDNLGMRTVESEYLGEKNNILTKSIAENQVKLSFIEQELINKTDELNGVLIRLSSGKSELEKTLKQIDRETKELSSLISGIEIQIKKNKDRENSELADVRQLRRIVQKDVDDLYISLEQKQKEEIAARLRLEELTAASNLKEKEIEAHTKKIEDEDERIRRANEAVEDRIIVCNDRERRQKIYTDRLMAYAKELNVDLKVD